MTPTPSPRCDRPPVGWLCTRKPGHDGPCAAVPCDNYENGSVGLRPGPCKNCGAPGFEHDRRHAPAEAAPPCCTLCEGERLIPHHTGHRLGIALYDWHPCPQCAEAAPPRATTPEPMTEDRYIELGALHRAGWRGFHYGRRVLSDLYNEVTRLRAPALWTLLEAAYAERDGGSRGRYPAQIALERAITALATNCEQAADNFDMMTAKWGESESARSTLERDAARMRDNERELRFAGGQLANVAFNLAQNGVLDARTRETLDACRKLWDSTTEKHVTAAAALSPYGEPTTTPVNP